MDGQDIVDVDEFTYLGATVYKEAGGMEYLKKRISKARSAFWRSSNILRIPKSRLYKPLVLPVLLYRCEPRKVNKGDNKAVDWFRKNCLRILLRVKWQKSRQHFQSFMKKRAGMKPLRKEIKKMRMEDGHIRQRLPNLFTVDNSHYQPS